MRSLNLREKIDDKFIFYFLVLLLCTIFFFLQFTYIQNLPLVMDEYNSAYKAFKIYKSTPYLDYIPYKNLMGYCLHGAMLQITDHHWEGLMLVKTYLVILNTFMLALGALLLKDHLSMRAVGLSLAMLVVMSTFLERGAELRVDMTATWLGFFSLLMILRDRWAWAGILAGLGFLVTQKAVYFLLAGEVALFFIWLQNSYNRKIFYQFLYYNIAALLPLLIYFIIWSIISGTPLNVLKGMLFVEYGESVILTNVYGNMHFKFWTQSIWRNPFFYFFMFLALWQLDNYRRRNPQDKVIQRCLPYCAAVAFFCFFHPKPWPYFMVMLFPFGYSICAVYIDRDHNLSTGNRKYLGFTPAALVVLVIFGLIWPLQRVDNVVERNLSYQQSTIKLSEWLLEENETYFGGVPYLYKHEQVHPDLTMLNAGQRIRLQQADSTTLQKYITAMQESKMKFVIHSYRTKALPKELKNFLNNNYMPLWGSVDIYAPKIKTNKGTFHLKFGGRYFLHSEEPINIDGQMRAPRTMIELSSGDHSIVSNNAEPGTIRLKLFPKGVLKHLYEKYKDRRPLFPAVYTY